MRGLVVMLLNAVHPNHPRYMHLPLLELVTHSATPDWCPIPPRQDSLCSHFAPLAIHIDADNSQRHWDLHEFQRSGRHRVVPEHVPNRCHYSIEFWLLDPASRSPSRVEPSGYHTHRCYSPWSCCVTETWELPCPRRSWTELRSGTGGWLFRCSRRPGDQWQCRVHCCMTGVGTSCPCCRDPVHPATWPCRSQQLSSEPVSSAPPSCNIVSHTLFSRNQCFRNALRFVNRLVRI
jgi:hypothetical protein